MLKGQEVIARSNQIDSDLVLKPGLWEMSMFLKNIQLNKYSKKLQAKKKKAKAYESYVCCWGLM